MYTASDACRRVSVHACSSHLHTFCLPREGGRELPKALHVTCSRRATRPALARRLPSALTGLVGPPTRHDHPDKQQCSGRSGQVVLRHAVTVRDVRLSYLISCLAQACTYSTCIQPFCCRATRVRTTGQPKPQPRSSPARHTTPPRPRAGRRCAPTAAPRTTSSGLHRSGGRGRRPRRGRSTARGSLSVGCQLGSRTIGGQLHNTRDSVVCTLPTGLHSR